MKSFIAGLLAVFSAAFGQQKTTTFAITKYVVPVSIQLSGNLELRATGIQIGPGIIVIPQSVIDFRTGSVPLMIVNDKLAERRRDLGNGLALLELPNGRIDSSFLESCQPSLRGWQNVLYAGYRNGQLGFRPGRVLINAEGVPVVDDIATIGIGWGIFSLDGKLIGIVRDYFAAAAPEMGPQKIKFTVVAVAGAGILTAAQKLPLFSNEFH